MSEEHQEKYIQQKLSAENLKKVEDELSANLSLQEDVALELGVKEAFEEKSREELREKVKRFEQPKKPDNLPTWKYLSVAASIVIIAGLTYSFLKGSESAFDRYYEIYPNYEETVLRNENTTDLRSQTFLFYVQSNYQKAMAGFDELLVQEPEEMAYFFFRAMCKIETEQLEKSLVDLERVIKSKSVDYKYPALWYSALILIKLDDKLGATRNLELLIENPNDFRDKASLLIEEL